MPRIARNKINPRLRILAFITVGLATFFFLSLHLSVFIAGSILSTPAQKIVVIPQDLATETVEIIT